MEIENEPYEFILWNTHHTTACVLQRVLIQPLSPVIVIYKVLAILSKRNGPVFWVHSEQMTLSSKCSEFGILSQMFILDSRFGYFYTIGVCRILPKWLHCVQKYPPSRYFHVFCVAILPITSLKLIRAEKLLKYIKLR